MLTALCTKNRNRRVQPIWNSEQRMNRLHTTAKACMDSVNAESETETDKTDTSHTLTSRPLRWGPLRIEDKERSSAAMKRTIYIHRETIQCNGIMLLVVIITTTQSDTHIHLCTYIHTTRCIGILIQYMCEKKDTRSLTLSPSLTHSVTHSLTRSLTHSRSHPPSSLTCNISPV